MTVPAVVAVELNVNILPVISVMVVPDGRPVAEMVCPTEYPVPVVMAIWFDPTESVPVPVVTPPAVTMPVPVTYMPDTMPAACALGTVIVAELADDDAIDPETIPWGVIVWVAALTSAATTNVPACNTVGPV